MKFNFFSNKKANLMTDYPVVILLMIIVLIFAFFMLKDFDLAGTAEGGFDSFYVLKKVKMCEEGFCDFEVCEGELESGCSEEEVENWKSLLTYYGKCRDEKDTMSDEEKERLMCGDLSEKIGIALGDETSIESSTSSLTLEEIEDLDKKLDALGVSGDKKSSVKKALEELKNWNSGSLKETNSKAYPLLKKYWESIGYNENAWSPAGTAWSAAFISYVVDDFSEEAHAKYINKVYNKEISGWEFQTIDSRKIEIGDIVCKTRNNDQFRSDDTYRSHCDIVVDIEGNEISIVGGNVGNSVSLVKINLNDAGLIASTDPSYIGVLIS